MVPLNGEQFGARSIIRYITGILMLKNTSRRSDSVMLRFGKTSNTSHRQLVAAQMRHKRNNRDPSIKLSKEDLLDFLRNESGS